MQKKGLPTNLEDARNAEQLEKQVVATAVAAVPIDKCTMRYVLPVMQPHRFLSARAATDLFIAEIATASKEADTNF